MEFLGYTTLLHLKRDGIVHEQQQYIICQLWSLICYQSKTEVYCQSAEALIYCILTLSKLAAFCRDSRNHPFAGLLPQTDVEQNIWRAGWRRVVWDPCGLSKVFVYVRPNFTFLAHSNTSRSLVHFWTLFIPNTFWRITTKGTTLSYVSDPVEAVGSLSQTRIESSTRNW